MVVLIPMIHIQAIRLNQDLRERLRVGRKIKIQNGQHAPFCGVIKHAANTLKLLLHGPILIQDRIRLHQSHFSVWDFSRSTLTFSMSPRFAATKRFVWFLISFRLGSDPSSSTENFIASPENMEDSSRSSHSKSVSSLWQK